MKKLENIIFKRNVQLLGGVILSLTAYKDINTYYTCASILYDDGEQIDLEPINSSNGDLYLWKNGNIYFYKGDSLIEETYFDINSRTYKRVTVSNETINEITRNITIGEETSIPFNEIIELENNHQLYGYVKDINPERSYETFYSIDKEIFTRANSKYRPQDDIDVEFVGSKDLLCIYSFPSNGSNNVINIKIVDLLEDNKELSLRR